MAASSHPSFRTAFLFALTRLICAGRSSIMEIIHAAMFSLKEERPIYWHPSDLASCRMSDISTPEWLDKLPNVQYIDTQVTWQVAKCPIYWHQCDLASGRMSDVSTVPYHLFEEPFWRLVYVISQKKWNYTLPGFKFIFA
jgi:hypothetical protein